MIASISQIKGAGGILVISMVTHDRTYSFLSDVCGSRLVASYKTSMRLYFLFELGGGTEASGFSSKSPDGAPLKRV